MRQFFGNLSLDRLSFWLGFLAGFLAWWLIGILRPWVKRLWVVLQERSKSARGSLTATTEIRLRNDVLQYTQHQHLASPLFSLDEIFIPTRLLAPPALVEPGAPPPLLDITETIIPYMPDWPEMGTAYGAPTLSLSEAIQGGMHIALVGHPGSGKTTCLAQLAAELCRPGSNDRQLAQQMHPPMSRPIPDLPVLIHVHDLGLPLVEPQDPLQNILLATSRYTSPLTQARLAPFLQNAFSDGRVLLLVDGMDEVPETILAQASAYLTSLLQKFPDIQIVASVAPGYFPDLPGLGFIPLSLAGWTESQRIALILRWREQWSMHVESTGQAAQNVDHAILDAWLLNDQTRLTPLEQTLKIWSVYAGDNMGPSGPNAIEAYLLRMSVEIPKAHLTLQNLAAQALISRTLAFTPKDAREWIFEYEAATQSVVTAANPASPAASEPITIPRVLPALVESGLLTSHKDGRLSFSNPTVAAYLAASTISKKGVIDSLTNQASWPILEQCCEYLAASADLSGLLARRTEADSQPLHSEMVSTARWLRLAREEAPWRDRLLRQLAGLAQDENQPIGLRARIVTALAQATSGADILFRQMLVSPHAASRHMAALACGLHRDEKAIEDLTHLLADPLPVVNRSACLALVGIGTRTAMEAVADCLLEGSDDLRRSAAQALANNIEEGHPTLREGATLDDLLVRKAVIAGLQRTRQPWARELIEKMRLEDAQWVVKNAATQALEELNQPETHPPIPLPELTETPWLIAFAGEKGIGVAPGKAAVDLLLLALKDGKEEQKLAALDIIRIKGDSRGVLPAYQILYASPGELREAAYLTLWHLQAAGIPLPPPAQFGLGYPH